MFDTIEVCELSGSKSANGRECIELWELRCCQWRRDHRGVRVQLQQTWPMAVSSYSSLGAAPSTPPRGYMSSCSLQDREGAGCGPLWGQFGVNVSFWCYSPASSRGPIPSKSSCGANPSPFDEQEIAASPALLNIYIYPAASRADSCACSRPIWH